jgi:uncharacterized membrane protein
MAKATHPPPARKLDRPAKSYAAFRGHPLHPMLVPLPIGAFAFLLVTDLVFLFTGDPFWARASAWLLLAGIITGGLAAIVGLGDYFNIQTARRPIGHFHAFGNMAALVVAILNYGIRLGDPGAAVWPWGLLLTLVMIVGLAATGWAGGELAYRHRVGVLPDDERY